MAGIKVDHRAKRRELGFNFPVGLPEPGSLGSGRSFNGPVLANEHRLADRQAPSVEGLEYLCEGCPMVTGDIRCPVVTVGTDPVYIRIAWIIGRCGTMYEITDVWAPDPSDIRGTYRGKDRVHVPPGRDVAHWRDGVSPVLRKSHLPEPAQQNWPVQRFKLVGRGADQAVIAPRGDQVCPRRSPRDHRDRAVAQIPPCQRDRHRCRPRSIEIVNSKLPADRTLERGNSGLLRIGNGRVDRLHPRAEQHSPGGRQRPRWITRHRLRRRWCCAFGGTRPRRTTCAPGDQERES